jgi:hypothetical protein
MLGAWAIGLGIAAMVAGWALGPVLAALFVFMPGRRSLCWVLVFDAIGR